MTASDKKRFMEIMYGVADNFGGSISKEGLALRFNAMAGHSIDQVALGASWLVKHRDQVFPAVPTVKEFIDAIKSATGTNVSVRTQAEVQLDLVLRKLKSQGRNAPIDFEHPVTFRLMTTRWPYNSWAATVHEDELKWFRKEFIEAFQAHTEQDTADQAALEYHGGKEIPGLEVLADKTVKLIS
jgi:hypothetical protein